jgi:hypothetical protein
MNSVVKTKTKDKKFHRRLYIRFFLLVFSRCYLANEIEV